MEQLLIKMARQLDGLDEASLMSLWDKYAAIVARFEPTRRWEEAALIFSLIQGKRWKNQLFNQQWAAQVKPVKPVKPSKPHAQELAQQAAFTLEPKRKPEKTPKKAAKVLNFRKPGDGI